MERRTELSCAHGAPKRIASYILAILAALLLMFVIIIVYRALGNLWHAEMTEDQALAELNSYCEGDMVNLDAYLRDQGFEATGAVGAYVYRRGDKIVSIQDYGDYVRIGNGKGTSHEYGTESVGGSYVCRVSWPATDPEAPDAHDIVLSAEALAEVVRWVYR